MEDQKIVELFLARDESAVARTMEKYADFCRGIASGILSDPHAVEECLKAVCDTIWETLPEKGTRDLPVYMARVTRSVSLNHWKLLPGSVRRETQVHSVTEELNRCVTPIQEEGIPLDRKALTRDLDRFLSELDDVCRAVFVGRYWYFRTPEQIAAKHHIAPEVVEAYLIRSRELLKQTISYPLKAGNILSCLGKVSGRFILPSEPQAEAPVRRPRKKKKSPTKLIITGIAVVILIGGLAAAWGFGLFFRDKADPDGLKDALSKPGTSQEGAASGTFTDTGTNIDVGSSSSTVLTAVYDKEQLYILVKSVPGSNDLFLIPRELNRNDSTGLLVGLNGIPEGTIEQYASYLGRRLAKITFTYAAGGAPLEGDSKYAFGDDGVLYYCFSAPLPEGGTEQVLISGSFYQDLEEATDAQSADLTIRLSRMPDAEETTVTSFAAGVSDEAQLQIDSALIEKTGLGYHVTFKLKMTEERDLLFLLTDGNGEPLPGLPGHTEAVSGETEDGYRTYRVSCQLPQDGSALYFTVTDQDTGIEYGPYDIS